MITKVAKKEYVDSECIKYVREIRLRQYSRVVIVLDVSACDKGSLLIQGSHNSDPVFSYVFWNYTNIKVTNLIGTTQIKSITYDEINQKIKIIIYSSAWGCFLIHSTCPISELYSTSSE